MSMKEEDIEEAYILDKQKEKLFEYMAVDFVGADLVESDTVDSIRDLYLNGVTAYSIAAQLDLQEEVVLYFIVDRGWDQKKHYMMEAIEDKIIEKIIDTKLKGVEAMTKILNVASDRFITGIDNYLKTKDEKYLIEVGITTLKDYKTAVDVLKAFMDSGKNRGNVNINLRAAKSTIDKKGHVVDVEEFVEPNIVEHKSERSLADIAEDKRKIARAKLGVDR